MSQDILFEEIYLVMFKPYSSFKICRERPFLEIKHYYYYSASNTEDWHLILQTDNFCLFLNVIKPRSPQHDYQTVRAFMDIKGSPTDARRTRFSCWFYHPSQKTTPWALVPVVFFKFLRRSRDKSWAL